MPQRPWKHSNVGASDAKLDAAVAAHEAQQAADRERRASEVNRLLSDAEIQAWRYAEQGGREPLRLVKVRGKWGRYRVGNRMHTATAAVNEGSLKAFRTTLTQDDPDPKQAEAALGSLPHRPSLAWLRTIDQNAAKDQAMAEAGQQEKKREGFAEHVDNSSHDIPVRRSYNPGNRKDSD